MSSQRAEHNDHFDQTYGKVIERTGNRCEYCDLAQTGQEAGRPHRPCCDAIVGGNMSLESRTVLRLMLLCTRALANRASLLPPRCSTVVASHGTVLITESGGSDSSRNQSRHFPQPKAENEMTRHVVSGIAVLSRITSFGRNSSSGGSAGSRLIMRRSTSTDRSPCPAKSW